MTVLIPTHGRPTLLKRTLESLKACTLPETYHELVVIENGSRDGAEKLVNDLPERLNARYMHRKRGNKSYALNEALEVIEDGLVIFFDDDVRVPSDIIVQYANAAAQYGAHTFFGGPTDVEYEAAPPDWLKPYLPGSARGWGLNGLEVESHPWFLGFNWAAFGADLLAVGGFDTNLGPGSPRGTIGQETDMQKRLKETGVEQVFVPGAKVWHNVPQERCSPQWALNRRYRNGLSSGIKNHYQEDSFLGVPWWTVKEIARSGYMYIRDTVKRDHQAAFASKANLCRYVGIVQGCRKRNISKHP